MPRVIVPRTEIMPDGGIRRIVRRPVFEFDASELENNAIGRWAQSWGGLVVKSHQEELEKIKSKKED